VYSEQQITGYRSAGQQLVQMPDGKLHVLNTAQVQTSQIQQVGSRIPTCFSHFHNLGYSVLLHTAREKQ
jgi:hypothetical protein